MEDCVTLLKAALRPYFDRVVTQFVPAGIARLWVAVSWTENGRIKHNAAGIIPNSLGEIDPYHQRAAVSGLIEFRAKTE